MESKYYKKREMVIE